MFEFSQPTHTGAPKLVPVSQFKELVVQGRVIARDLPEVVQGRVLAYSKEHRDGIDPKVRTVVRSSPSVRKPVYVEDESELVDNSRSRYAPFLNINSDDNLEDTEDDLDYTNVIDIPESLLEEVNENVERVSKSLSDSFLKQQASLLMAHDTAVAYAETAMKDGFGVDVTIEDTALPLVELTSLVSQLNIFVDHANLPEDQAKLIRSSMIEGLCTKALKDIDSSKNSFAKKFKQELDNLHGNITSRLGVVKGRSSGAPHGEEEKN